MDDVTFLPGWFSFECVAGPWGERMSKELVAGSKGGGGGGCVFSYSQPVFFNLHIRIFFWGGGIITAFTLAAFTPCRKSRMLPPC